MQNVGEHPYCGPNGGLEEKTGFTYDPAIFKQNGIDVQLFSFKDMEFSSSINFVFNCLKVIDKALKNKTKVLIHCHSGYGRTGVILCCYLIFLGLGTAKEVIKLIRLKRIECIQNATQFEFCVKFYECDILKKI